MHLELTVGQRALTAAIHDFVAEWLPVPIADSEYFAALCDRGWSAPGWPKPWGGGLEAAEAYLVERTLARAGAPMLDTGTLHHIGPLLMALADDDICHRFLPAMAAGRTRWAMHGSLQGGQPLTGCFLAGGVQLDVPRTLVFGAREADALVVLIEESAETALAVAELPDSAVVANQPLDPDTVYLQALNFELLATTRTHPTLAPALALRRGVDPGSGADGWGCRTGRLRNLFDRLLQRDSLAHAELSALGVALAGLEAMEQRAAFTADAGLRRAVTLRCAELGQALAALWIDGLGYYALPAPESARQHNELPEQALTARDAMAELIRYLEGDFGLRRDSLAQSLGIASAGDLAGD